MGNISSYLNAKEWVKPSRNYYICSCKGIVVETSPVMSRKMNVKIQGEKKLERS